MADSRWQSLAPSSYQGRYLLLAVLLVILLLLIAWRGHEYITQVTGMQVARIAERAQTEKQLKGLVRQLEEVDTWLNRQLIHTGTRQETSLSEKIASLGNSIDNLDSRSLGSDGRQLLAFISSTRLPQLQQEAEKFLQVTHDNSLRFPSTAIMQTMMRDQADAFASILANGIHELAPPQAITSVLLIRIHELSNTWQHMLSEFRLLVANRFGVFSDNPEAGMAARAQNIATYFEHLHSLLDQVQQIQLPEDLLSVSQDTWQKLRDIANSWHHHYQGLMENLDTKEWRHDIFLYEKVLAPQLSDIKQDLTSLLDSLDNQATGDIKGLTGIAEHLTQAIFLLTFLGISLVIGAYLYLRVSIIQPITETTKALRQEAAGIREGSMPTPKLQETRDLVDAFSEMRREVWKRQEGLDHLAHHDPLTQLPNRVLFKDRLEHAIKMAQRNNQVVALLFLDLDNFKQINDSLGHLAGDELLLKVARRIQDAMRSSDTVARLGGDEFAILLESIDGKRQAKNAAVKILQTLAKPLELSGHEFHVTGSIGIAMAPYDDNVPDDLIRDADSAMYEAKHHGKNTYHFFSTELLDRATNQLNLERQLRRAIKENEFIYHYQPIVHAASNRLSRVEALLRWQPRNAALRYPDEFISTLLTLDGNQGLTERLLRQVDELQEKFKKELDIPLRVSINLPSSALRNTQQHRNLLTSLERRRFPSLITIEITEDTLLEDLTNARILLTEIKRLGIPLVLDDFGTGQSSLNHLRSFPFNAIKIDKEFVMNMTEDRDDAILVKAVTQLAHSFGMKVVAEGVETAAQRELLLKIGCDYLQGYFIGKPMAGQTLFEQFAKLRQPAAIPPAPPAEAENPVPQESC